MIIGVSGYGFTGSGAVLDLLKEYRQLEVVDDFEFSFIYKPDGIETLEHFLITSPSRYFGCDTAIRRFKKYCKRMKRNYDKHSNGMFSKYASDYIESIIQTSWRGTSAFHSVECGNLTYFVKYNFIKRIRYLFEKKIKKINGTHFPDIKMYMSIKPEGFTEKTREFIKKIIDEVMEDNSRIPVLDQPFSADNPQKSFHYFENPYAIIVDKDPRDLYLLAKTSLGMSGRFIPSDDVQEFVKYYKAIMEYRDENRVEKENILYLHFEDLIYAYTDTKRNIEKFLGICNPDENFKCFYPEKSINNTQLFLKYPEYAKDIRFIEKELSNWLYDFSKYKTKPSFDNKSF